MLLITKDCSLLRPSKHYSNLFPLNSNVKSLASMSVDTYQLESRVKTVQGKTTSCTLRPTWTQPQNSNKQMHALADSKIIFEKTPGALRGPHPRSPSRSGHIFAGVVLCRKHKHNGTEPVDHTRCTHARTHCRFPIVTSVSVPEGRDNAENQIKEQSALR